jgi:hypothetical protein
MNAVIHALYGHCPEVRHHHVEVARTVLAADRDLDPASARYACDVLTAFGDAADHYLGWEMRYNIAVHGAGKRTFIRDLILVLVGALLAILIMWALVSTPSVLRVISTTSLLELPPASVGGFFRGLT